MREFRGRSLFGLVGIASSIYACNNQPVPKTEPPAAPKISASVSPGQTNPAPSAARSIDAALVAKATGGKPETSDNVVKVSFPRNDVPVQVDGWTMPPFMGLTSWAAFTPGEKPGVEAMIMGDLVLFEDEVSEAMSAALDAGLEVTALHNHFFFDKPKVFFMHIGGEGQTEALGQGVRKTLDTIAAIRKKTPEPRARFASPPIPSKNSIDGSKIETALGVKGTAKDGMYKVVIGRSAIVADCGCNIGKAMGVNTWAAFAGTNEDAVVDGDFAVLEKELQSVLKVLRGGGIHVVAIHHHMVGENPRVLFLHYWGRGPVKDLTNLLLKGLELTKDATK